MLHHTFSHLYMGSICEDVNVLSEEGAQWRGKHHRFVSLEGRVTLGAMGRGRAPHSWAGFTEGSWKEVKGGEKLEGSRVKYSFYFQGTLRMRWVSLSLGRAVEQAVRFLQGSVWGQAFPTSLQPLPGRSTWCQGQAGSPGRLLFPHLFLAHLIFAGNGMSFVFFGSEVSESIIG